MNWSGEEKRKFPRADFPCRVIIDSAGRALISHTENIGEGGIRIFLHERLKESMEVGLELIFGKEKKVACQARVVWVQGKVNPLSGETDVYDTGLQFMTLQEADKEYIRGLVKSIIS